MSIAPALEPRVGGAALGVPQVNAPVSEGAAKASPYYFTDGSLQGWQATPQDIVVPSNGLASPEAFGLPGDDALRELLAVHRDVPVSRASGGDVPRYFIDDAHAAEPQGQLYRGAHPPFDVNAIRRDFPILQERVNGKQLVWFDNAATTHKPQAVIDRLAYFYAHENSNIHRAAHALAGRATDAYEHARETVQRFIGASSPDEIVFVRGTTEAINLIAKSWACRTSAKATRSSCRISSTTRTSCRGSSLLRSRVRSCA